MAASVRHSDGLVLFRDSVLEKTLNLLFIKHSVQEATVLFGRRFGAAVLPRFLFR